MYMNRPMLGPGVGYTFTNGTGGMSLVIDDVAPTPAASPFTVTKGKLAGDNIVRIVPGMVNGVIPYIDGTLMNDPTLTPLVVPPAAGLYVVAIQCNADPAPASFPKSDTEIVIEPYPTTDTDTEGYIALAILTVTAAPSGGFNVALNQSVSGSLWAERHKYTEPGSASYFFYRV
jgi:hypothetical protein